MAEATASGKPSYPNFQASISSPQRNHSSQPRPLGDRPSSGPGLSHQQPPTTPATPAPLLPRVTTPLSSRAPSALTIVRARPSHPHPASLPLHALDKARRPRTVAWAAAGRGVAAMSVAYEPRSFLHEGAYPPIGDEHDHDHDHAADQRYTDSDVAEHLSHYTADASILADEREVLGDGRDVLGDDRGVLGDDRGIMSDDAGAVQDATRLDLGPTGFSSPIQVPLPDPPSMPNALRGSKDPSPCVGSPSSASRIRPIPKPDRDVAKQADGKFHCPLPDCREDVRAFSRKCEWNKHMDKHERPYRCPADGCENLPGFTYSGGLLRHEREVHGKHGGPKNTVNCPHPNCKRHTGKGFSRQENLNEHLRRVHTNMEGSTPPAAESVASPDDNESEKSGSKRKRRPSDQGDELSELRDELKRVREENEKLKSEMEQQSQHQLGMMAQIAELQDALRHGLGQHGLGAPTAQMI
ncbi:Uncharacterized protein TPAR_07388 [Tolypocladium paradoxum]|uniref:C2H2-type domain-containing protein n=1 Tax=Tolypocladium paradoxum TaxID=94208 RepID=A0A2S4KQE4_9HYPO|nr:Uncharacterized protein TPAR_07388 [Tolypocladium paradoxum]